MDVGGSWGVRGLVTEIMGSQARRGHWVSKYLKFVFKKFFCFTLVIPKIIKNIILRIISFYIKKSIQEKTYFIRLKKGQHLWNKFCVYMPWAEFFFVIKTSKKFKKGNNTWEGWWDMFKLTSLSEKINF